MSNWRQANIKLDEASARGVMADAGRDSLRDALVASLGMIARVPLPPAEPPPVDPTPADPPPVEPPPNVPPPAPVEVTGALAMWDSKSGITAAYFNYLPQLPWRKVGKWLDTAQLPNGPTPFASMVFPKDAFPRTQDVDITALAKRWRTANTGAFLRATGSLQIATRRNVTAAHRPALVLTYSDAAQTVLEAQASPATSGSASPEVLTVAKLDANRFMLVQFALPARDFVSAALRLTNVNQYGARINVFEVLQPKFWDGSGEVERGIAAAHPGDKDLRKHPDCYFAWDFVPCPDGPERIWERQFLDHPTDWQKNVPVSMTGGPSAGPCLNGRIPPGSSGSNLSFAHEWTRNGTSWHGQVTITHNPHNGLQTAMATAKGARPDPSHVGCPEELFLRYYWKPAIGYQCAIEGCKLPGIAYQFGYWSGQRYSGGDGNGGAPTKGMKEPDGFLSGGSFRLLKKPTPTDGPYSAAGLNLIPLGVYAYWPHQPGTWGDYWQLGSDDTGWVAVTEDKWYCIEQRVKMNTVRGRTAEEQVAWLANRTAYKQGKLDQVNGYIAKYSRTITAVDALEAEAASGTVLTYAYAESRGVALSDSLDGKDGATILAAVIQKRAEARYDLAKQNANLIEWNAYPLPVFAAGFDQFGNGIGEHDGIVEVWLDGVKVLSRPGLLLRHHPALKIESAWFDHLHGGNYKVGAEHPPEGARFAVANVALARKYIGPLVGVA